MYGKKFQPNWMKGLEVMSNDNSGKYAILVRLVLKYFAPQTGFRWVHKTVSVMSTNRFLLGPQTGFRQVHKPVSNRSTNRFLIGPQISFQQVHKTVFDRSTNQFPIGPPQLKKTNFCKNEGGGGGPLSLRQNLPFFFIKLKNSLA